MDGHQQQLLTYIRQQLQSGQTPDEIAVQLHGTNWPEDTVRQAFHTLQAEVVPAQYQHPQAPSNAHPQPAEQQQQQQQQQQQPQPESAGSPALPAHPQATTKRRGRIRTGWQLFKQSMTILRGNRYLFRFMLMTGVWVFGITLVLLLVLVFIGGALFTGNTVNNTGFNTFIIVMCALDYIFIYFFINLYAAGLTANVFDLFEGRRQPYKAYMHRAWSKWPALLVFSLIAATVGMILQFIVERIKWVGQIIAWLLGTLWSLGTLFVVPIIVASDQPSGVKSIGQSVRFFKQTWGENITAKASVNVPLFFVNLLILFVFVLLFVGAASVHSIALIIILSSLYFIIILTVAVIGSFANSLVNIALYYFASTGRVPPAFSEELLNQVFIKRKRRFLKKKGRQDTEQQAT